ncbi:MAG: hypothetical protein V7704_17870 [Aurantimonas endophytica]|uniref:hypothetical protein n=1 Tax=Aurantimonas endophytica TaxID=1522175 RepID=UPI003002DBE9
MDKFKRAGLAGLTILALGALPLAAQAQSDPAPAASQAPAESTGSENAPDPAATETPQDPAASGGDASDITPSGGPGGGTTTDDGSTDTDTDTDTDTGEQQSGQPRNAVGDKFELPRVSEGNQVELIAGLCGVQMKQMTPLACTCLAEQALEKLSDPQRDYLIASVVAPPVAERMLGDGRVGQPDQETIFAFLNATSEACVTGRFVEPTEGAAPQATPPATAPSPDGTAPADGAAPAN